MRRVIRAVAHRLLLPAHVRADIRDNELLAALLQELLEPGSERVNFVATAAR
jgi:hypothetical protein